MALSLYYSLVAHFVECRSECGDKAVFLGLHSSKSTLVAAEGERQMLLSAFGTAHHKNWVLWGER